MKSKIKNMITGETKVCSKCGEEKPINEFYFRKDNNKYRNECKICFNKNVKVDKAKQREYSKKYREKYNISEYNKEYRKNNKEKIKQCQKEYYLKNKTYVIKKTNRYYKENKSKANKQKAVYIKKKRNNDPLFKLKCNLSRAISHSFEKRSFIKSNRTENILGCSIEYFKRYIESKFEPWMNWDNYGLYNGEPNYGWEIDHIIPTCSAITENDVIKLNHYTNLQPLCSYVNRAVKRGKILN